MILIILAPGVSESLWLTEQILWWISTAMCYLLGWFFLMRIREYGISSKFIYGLTLFFLSFGSARAIENLRKFYVSTDAQDVFTAWISNTQIMGLNLYLRIAYYVICWISITLFYFTLEPSVFSKKMRYTLGFSAIIEGILSVLGYVKDWTKITIYFTCAGFIVAGMGAIFVLFYLGIKNKAKIRKALITASLGLLCFVLGVMADLPESLFLSTISGWQIYSTPIVGSIISPLAVAIGMILISIGFVILFRSGGDPSLWLSNIWIIEPASGLCVFEQNFVEAKQMDANLITGFLTAIMSFGKNLSKTTLKHISFQDYAIYFYQKEFVLLALAVTENAPPIDVANFSELLHTEFQKRYKPVLQNFSGDVSQFEQFGKFVEEIADKKSLGAKILEAKVIKFKVA